MAYCTGCRAHGVSLDHACPPAPPITMASLIETHGSFRRLVQAYWFDNLEVPDERILEDAIPKETLASYKPLLMPGMTQPYEGTI